MPNYQGVWSLSEQYQAIGSQNWPMAPGAPTGVSATAGDAQATVSFTAPSFTGVPPGITEFRATSDPDAFTATGSASPITVTGLTNGTSYTFSVQATNGVQFGPAGTSGDVTPEPAPVAFFYDAGASDTSINKITIDTTGNATDFGTISESRNRMASCSSKTTAFFAGSDSGTRLRIDSITFASGGSSSTFGNLDFARYFATGSSNNTRGIFGGGRDSGGTVFNVIDYITFASAGDATDFGDLTLSRSDLGACASSTRSVFGGGYGTSNTNVMDYVTTASTGNASDFGDLSMGGYSNARGVCSSSTRGIFAGLNLTNTIAYITIASTGNSVDFGDLNRTFQKGGSASSKIRGVIAGGETSGGAGLNVIDYITIASVGNATDFGDLTTTTADTAGASSAHGGLS